MIFMKNLLLWSCLICLAPRASAQERRAPWFVERLQASGGYFLSFPTTDVQVSETGFLGTEVNLENDLGFNDQIHSVRAGLQWRASARSRIDFSYNRLHRSATHQLRKTIRFGENVYQVNAETDAYFNADIFRLSYGYAIFQGPRHEAGLMAGVHVVRTDMGIALTSREQGVDVQDDYALTAPLPNVGIWGGFAITPRLAVDADASYMSLTVNDVHGDILTGNLHLTYRVAKGFSAALGYSGTRLKMDGERNGLLGDVDWRYHGPSLSVSYAFGNKRW